MTVTKLKGGVVDTQRRPPVTGEIPPLLTVSAAVVNTMEPSGSTSLNGGHVATSVGTHRGQLARSGQWHGEERPHLRIGHGPVGHQAWVRLSAAAASAAAEANLGGGGECDGGVCGRRGSVPSVVQGGVCGGARAGPRCAWCEDGGALTAAARAGEVTSRRRKLTANDVVVASTDFVNVFFAATSPCSSGGGGGGAAHCSLLDLQLKLLLAVFLLHCGFMT